MDWVCTTLCGYLYFRSDSLHLQEVTTVHITLCYGLVW